MNQEPTAMRRVSSSDDIAMPASAAPCVLFSQPRVIGRRAVQAETDEGSIDLTLEKSTSLGRGRGARVDLVRDLRTGRLIAEKVFTAGGRLSSLITKILYWLCFQSPFPYRTTARAVWTAYYRRKALRLLTEYWFGAPCVADALYVRWDEDARAFVLGTQYIAGRGPRIGPPNPSTRPCWRRARSHSPGPRDDMGELLAFMDRLRLHLGESGFIGAQWQVDRRTLVATANLLHNGERWIAVDLESGVPAVTLLRYWVQGALLGRFPLFDDTDFRAVWSYIDRHAENLIQQLGPAKAGALRYALKELEAQERLWKAGEVALLREPRRWMAPEGRDHIRQQALDRWMQEGRLSPQAAARAAASTLRFLGHWLFGGLMSRTRRLARFVRDPEYRSTVVAPCLAAWVQNGRIQPDTATRLLQHPHLLPLAGLALCSLIPASLLRCLREPLYRRWAIRRLYQVLLDEQYQLSLAEQFILRRIQEWERAHGLTAEESNGLRRLVATPSAQEYVRGFGVHLALKALFPSALFDPLFVGLAVGMGSVYPLGLVFIRSLAITAYTIFRWAKRRDLHFGTALTIGLVPKIGFLAYPTQLLTVHPELASFLVRDIAAQMAERLPIYGGRHTLTQYYSVRCADLLLSCGHRFARVWQRVSEAAGFRR